METLLLQCQHQATPPQCYELCWTVPIYAVHVHVWGMLDEWIRCSQHVVVQLLFKIAHLKVTQFVQKRSKHQLLNLYKIEHKGRLLMTAWNECQHWLKQCVYLAWPGHSLHVFASDAVGDHCNVHMYISNCRRNDSLLSHTAMLLVRRGNCHSAAEQLQDQEYII